MTKGVINVLYVFLVIPEYGYLKACKHACGIVRGLRVDIIVQVLLQQHRCFDMMYMWGLGRAG